LIITAFYRRIRRLEPPKNIGFLNIEKLPEGVYLATSDDIQGLVARGRTTQETLEIARDVAKKLLEARSVTDEATAGRLPEACERFDYPLVVAT
jgi:predicted RNase H-like HicB family nuclease